MSGEKEKILFPREFALRMVYRVVMGDKKLSLVPEIMRRC
jgi:hypothetical protein